MKNKQKIIIHTFDKAKKRLVSAKTLLKIENYNDSISRSYYAILDIIRGLLEIEDTFTKTHKGAISKFSDLYIKIGKVDQKYAKIISDIESQRGKADYDLDFIAKEKDAKDALDKATEFVDLIEKYHNQKKLF